MKGESRCRYAGKQMQIRADADLLVLY